MKVTRCLREENILSAVAYMMGMVSAYLLNISNLCLGSVLTAIAKYLLTSCTPTKPWKLFIPTGMKVSVFRTNDFSVLIIGLNTALR